MFLNVAALNSKGQPLANTNITLIGNDGSKYEGVTNAKGRIKNLELNTGVTYELIGESKGKVSKKETFNTLNVKTKKVIEKTLVIGTKTNIKVTTK